MAGEHIHDWTCGNCGCSNHQDVIRCSNCGMW